MSSINAKPSLKLETKSQMPPPPTTSVPSAVENPKPILKVNTARRTSVSTDGATPTPSGEKKTIKIKLNSQPNTPAAANKPSTPSVSKTKAGRTTKPTAKLTESKKRQYDSDEDQPMSLSRADSNRPSKMIKIKPSTKTPTTPFSTTTPINSIRFRPKGEPVKHNPGDAYDSEASDREEDPQRESNFILRVMDSVSADYLRKALADGNLGVSKANGGADFSVQFIDARERRAMVQINEVRFAAVLVQLPTITEAMKTWDRKSMMKNSDISEMLLCFAVVNNEQEAKVAPLPNMVDKNELQWPHGITPPMHDAPRRRFRKVLSERQWLSTQARVERLLKEDENWDEVRVEMIDEAEGEMDYDDDEDEDADGEADQDDYFGSQAGQVQNEGMDVDADAEGDDDILLAAELEAAMMEENDAVFDEAEPTASLEAPTPMTMDANTPAALQDAGSGEEEEEEEDVSDEDDDDDDDDVDEEQQAEDNDRKQHMSQYKELQKQLAAAEENLKASTMAIMQKRIRSTIDNIKKELAVKKAALNLTEDED
ncbi:hypothetical protein F5Y15DRAFT_376200 [Xylariaceae sp. FL0016]|nr:hypothetical protein F5Y15DRAFT_376200 [Xylariaceae sp. FL0016]